MNQYPTFAQFAIDSTAQRILLGSIDMDGYNGRDRHPEKTDSGKRGFVAGMFYHVDDAYGDDIEGQPPYLRIWVVRLEDDRIIEVLDHEIEALTPVATF